MWLCCYCIQCDCPSDLWFMVCLNCEMRSRVTIKRVKWFSESEHSLHLQLTVLYGLLFFVNKVNCKVGPLHKKLATAFERPTQNHTVICAIRQLVTVTDMFHIQIPLRSDLTHVLSFAFPHFEKFSFQDVSVYSTYNIPGISLDKFDYFSPILKLMTCINQAFPLYYIAKFYISHTHKSSTLNMELF